MHRFLTRVGRKNAVATDVRLAQRNNRYTTGELLLALLYPMILGLGRIESTQLLRQNGVFQYLAGLPSYPGPTTLRRFLLRAAPTASPHLRKLHDRFLARMSVWPCTPSRLILDVDSTVLVLYGKQSAGPRSRSRLDARCPYQVLVTNLPLQPLNLWRFYNDRAGIELIIKQRKGDYALGSIPTRH
jgi:hypothetical protein